MKKSGESEALIGVLNQSLGVEYGALFLLPQHLARISDRVLQRHLRGIMEMELEHAEKTARIIIALGGQPTADMPNLRPRNSAREILKVHLAGEKRAIELYSQAAAQCPDAKLREILLELQREEEGHQRLIEADLAKLE